MWNLKNSTNELIYKNRNRLTDRKQTYGYQRGNGGGGIHWEYGVHMGVH